MNIWIYRPDIEAAERKINKNFVYSVRGGKYYDVVDRKNMLKSQIDDVSKELRKKRLTVKIEVPDE